MQTWAEFHERTGSKSLISGKVSLGVGRMRDTLANVAWDGPLGDQLADLAQTYMPAVLEEIADLDAARAADWQTVARRAIIFGLASPQRDVDQAIDIARHIERDWTRLCTLRGAHELTFRIVTRDGRVIGCSGWKTLAANLHACFGLIENPTPERFTVPAMEALAGAGPKVARMILAVANPHQRVWTLDLWHGRQLLAMSGQTYAHKISVVAVAYADGEQAFLAWAERTMPNVPAWARQWATWCAAFGSFKSHRHLWADIVPAVR